MDVIRPVAEWRRRGVTTVTGASLPQLGDSAIYLPAGAKGPAFLLPPNFNVLLKYNNAASYALRHRRAGRPHCRPRRACAGPGRAMKSCCPAIDRMSFQRALAAAGFDPGTADGVLGRRTRAATAPGRKAVGLSPMATPSTEMLAVLQANTTATRWQEKSPPSAKGEVWQLSVEGAFSNSY